MREGEKENVNFYYWKLKSKNSVSVWWQFVPLNSFDIWHIKHTFIRHSAFHFISLRMYHMYKYSTPREFNNFNNSFFVSLSSDATASRCQVHKENCRMYRVPVMCHCTVKTPSIVSSRVFALTNFDFQYLRNKIRNNVVNGAYHFII